MPPSPQNFRPELETLSRLFHAKLAELGEFAAVSAGELPALYRKLLAHDEHMTETVEAYHGCPVDVRVLARRADEGLYSREILLAPGRNTVGRGADCTIPVDHSTLSRTHAAIEESGGALAVSVSSSGRSSGRIVCPLHTATAYSRAFSSSRTLPGQG